MAKYNTDRYQRQITLLGEEGQESLRRARVLVAGVGGLGTVASLYLALAGVGFLRLVDNDRVEISNLNRQMLFQPDDIGGEKVAVARKKLEILNPAIDIESVNKTINDDTMNELIKDIDLVVDTLDNFTTRFILNKAAFGHRIPMIHGAVRGFFGQATTLIPGKTACLQCIFAQSTPHETFPVLGATCGVIGAIQAAEAVKILTGRGEPLADRLFFWDGRAGDATITETKRNPACAVCGKG